MLIEILISLLFTIDFCLKIRDPKEYLENSNYGFNYLIIDIIAGPGSLIHDIIFLILFS